mmetsp:Transcript_47125/g.127123  ORF Transcript_47125/g.127123 Transcript_47125/m.127123 type:complete len:252 (+) Transcript_47125:1011-1766(+)
MHRSGGRPREVRARRGGGAGGPGGGREAAGRGVREHRLLARPGVPGPEPRRLRRAHLGGHRPRGARRGEARGERAAVGTALAAGLTDSRADALQGDGRRQPLREDPRAHQPDAGEAAGGALRGGAAEGVVRRRDLQDDGEQRRPRRQDRGHQEQSRSGDLRLGEPERGHQGGTGRAAKPGEPAEADGRHAGGAEEGLRGQQRRLPPEHEERDGGRERAQEVLHDRGGREPGAAAGPQLWGQPAAAAAAAAR